MSKNAKYYILPIFAIFACIVFGLTGCKDQERVARIAVNYATLKVIDWQVDKAERVLEIASTVRKTLAGEQALTVVELETLVRSQIEWHRLDAADTMLVDMLLLEVSLALEERLGDAPEFDIPIRIGKVLGWVERAAKLVDTDGQRAPAPNPSTYPARE